MSSANFLSGVDGTGQQVSADRNLESSQKGGFNDLGTEDFMELLIKQLQNQNPRDPMKNKEMMGQISQLTQLEQTQNLSDKIDGISKSSRNSQYISILGANVNVATKDGQNLSGQLSKVSFQNGDTNIEVGGEKISADNVASIGVDN